MNDFAGFGRIETMNFIIEKRGYQSYLEIGCRTDECFVQIRCARKVGVDPLSGGTLRTTSDEFFASDTSLFDLIFIDGDHNYPQVLRDIQGALEHLAPGGLITMHDCWPPTLIHENHDLCGTVWRAFARTRERPDVDAAILEMPADPVGLGIVMARANSDQIAIRKDLAALTYGDMLAHERDWMRKMPIVEALRFAGVIP